MGSALGDGGLRGQGGGWGRRPVQGSGPGTVGGFHV